MTTTLNEKASAGDAEIPGLKVLLARDEPVRLDCGIDFCIAGRPGR